MTIGKRDKARPKSRNSPQSKARSCVTIVAVAHIGTQELLLVLAVAGLLFIGANFRELYARVYDAISNLRGGPGSPNHPLPADDSRVLTRRRKPSENS
jgi:hypothetical protein